MELIINARKTEIKKFADQIGQEVGEVISSFIQGIYSLPKESESKSVDFTKGDVLLSAIDVARHLNISKAKAYQLIQSGKISSICFDRTLRVRRQDLEEFILQNLRPVL
jgi:excisionase family DNA binding protein